MSPEDRLIALNLVLPELPAPVGNYLAWRRVGQTLYISGHGPRTADGLLKTGRVGQNCTVEEAYQDARNVGLQLLAIMREAAGSLNHIECVVKLLGMVNAVPEFGDQPKVINGCSDLIVEVLGDRGKHARSAVGLGSLPGGISVEVEAIVQIAPDY